METGLETLSILPKIIKPGIFQICLTLTPMHFPLHQPPFTNLKPGLELENTLFKDPQCNSPSPFATTISLSLSFSHTHTHTHTPLSTFPPNNYSDTPTFKVTNTKLPTRAVRPLSDPANDVEPMTSYDSLFPPGQRSQIIPKVFLIIN